MRPGILSDELRERRGAVFARFLLSISRKTDEDAGEWAKTPLV